MLMNGRAVLEWFRSFVILSDNPLIVFVRKMWSNCTDVNEVASLMNKSSQILSGKFIQQNSYEFINFSRHFLCHEFALMLNFINCRKDSVRKLNTLYKVSLLSCTDAVQVEVSSLRRSFFLFAFLFNRREKESWVFCETGNSSSCSSSSRREN